MDLKTAARKSAQSLWGMLPILLGMLLLIGLINSFLTPEVYSKIFGHGTFLDSFLGAILGSISSGAPLNSYILGGEFLKNGVGIGVITAFIVSWVSVGVLQFPLEGKILGVKFSLVRNISAFFLSLVAAVITSYLMLI